MALTFTPEQAEQILASKNLTSENVRTLLLTTPLKVIAKQNKIGHVRLSACAHALNLYGKSNAEKIKDTLIKRHELIVQENEKSVDETFIMSELRMKTVSKVAKENTVTETWVRNLCHQNYFTPIEVADLPTITGEARKRKNEQQVITDHGEELLKLLKQDVSFNEIIQSFPYSKPTLKRAAKLLYPQYFSAEVKTAPSSKTFLVGAEEHPPIIGPLSLYQSNIKNFLDDNDISYEVPRKNILTNKREELGFYFPTLNMGIEVNPTYTHNSTYGWGYKPENAISKNYHAKKVDEANKVGVSLIMLYEKDLTEPHWTDITLPFLKFKLLGATKVFYGREVTVMQARNLSERNESRQFIEQYHSQGGAKAQHYYLIRHRKEGTLLGVCSFSENKHIRRNETHAELKRMVFLPGTQIRFGLSKVVSQFFKDFGSTYSTLYSYSRNDMGSGMSYMKAGFSFVRETGPSLSYVNPADPHDSYSWSINSSWGAKSGLLAKHFTSTQLQNFSRQELITQHLPRRTGNGVGYVELYNSGNKLWRFDSAFNEFHSEP